jgi:YgiT-type zinc finger domain-containing protein
MLEVEHVHRWKGNWYLLRNVPAEACQQCGEVFFAPEALKEMDNLVSKGFVPEGHIAVPVYSFP